MVLSTAVALWSTRLRRRPLWLPLALSSWSYQLLASSAVVAAFHPPTCLLQNNHGRVKGYVIAPPLCGSSYHRYFRLYSSTGTESSHDDIPTGGSSAVLSQKPDPTDASELQMLSFYHFEDIQDPLQARDSLFESINHIPGLRGTFYVAREGINAQLAVPPGEPLHTLLESCSTSLPFDPFANQTPNLGDVVSIDTPTFDRLVVRVRDYILRDGISHEIAASLNWSDAGPELSPSEWHDQVQKDKVVLIDCRNLYESEQGTFDGAIPLGTATFQESWDKLERVTADLPKDAPVHIFCTGGIRCVKVGAYMKQHLKFSDVRRLEHGIIGYEKFLEEHPEMGTSTFQGDNFLFDKRRFEEKKDSNAHQ
ncbi:rhodanese domain containing protein [Nitzschia inconspicua]|uniref:Rhodanese domain containing protein n=1 Tax=Nitzschia inconspicua TaxID=303405 RepID=A0A9K3L6S6_9STRA|nr:rhodanese domain containing protein [Nitzschia inconspicua]